MPLPPHTSPENRALLRTSIHCVLAVATGLTLSACRPGNREAKQLRGACDAGDVAACTKLAVKLRKGEYVLRDETRAAALFERACTGGIGEGCASFGGMLQTGTG